MLVGIGPGSTEHMTARARAAIAEADTIIGYVTYIKLVADLIEGKEIIRKSMTEELDRAIEALERAREGKKVALISSGDAGVTLMVGFWLSISNDAAPVADWALFAASYTSLVAVEPLLTIGLVSPAGRLRGSRVGQRLLAACIDEGLLRRAAPAASAASAA